MPCQTVTNDAGWLALGQSNDRLFVGVKILSSNAAVGATLSSLTFTLKAVGSPTGTVSAVLLASDQTTVKATSTNTLDLSTLTSDYIDYVFSFGGSVTISANDNAGINNPASGTDNSNQCRFKVCDPSEYSDQDATEKRTSGWTTYSGRSTSWCYNEASPPSSSGTRLPPPPAFVRI